MKIKLIIVLTCFAVSCGPRQPQTAADNKASLKFETIDVENFEKHPKGTGENDGFSYKINFVYPSEYNDPAVLEKLQNRFIRYTLGENYLSMMSGNTPATLEKAVDAYIAVLRKAYYDNMEELQNDNSDPDLVIGWHIECSNSILFMNETLLQLQTKDGFYPYGAHTFESASCHLFNLQTGDEYARDDIFKPEAAESMRQLIIPELLKQWGEDMEFDRNKVWTPETHFALTGEGLFIVYNADDLDAFTVGCTSFTIPYEKIKPYLREGTPVWEVAN